MIFSSARSRIVTWLTLVAIQLVLSHLGLAAQVDSLTAPDSAGYQLRILRFTYPKIDIRITYPELDGASPAVKEINRQLREYAREKLDGYRAGAFEGLRMLREIEKKERPGRRVNDSNLFDLYAHERVRLWRLGDTLTSVIFEAEWFFGGAHPANEYRSFLFDLTSQKPRPVASTEIFRQDSAATAVLTDAYVRAAMRAEARRKEPRFTADQLRAAVSPDVLETLALTPAGVLVEGRPLARYIGAVQALIPFESISSVVIPESPLGRYLAARGSRGG